MKYAVISFSGQEYKVSEGDIVKFNNTTSFEPKVVAYMNGDTFQVGTPYLDEIIVLGEILGDEKGKKMHITRFKAKSRYDKTTGYRSSLTAIRITSIGKKGEKADAKDAKPATKVKSKPQAKSEPNSAPKPKATTKPSVKAKTIKAKK